MKLSDLCKGTYPSCSKLRSHAKFIDALFEAGGSKLYESESYKKKLFSGDKIFTDNLKESLRGNDNLALLTAFFEENIADEDVVNVIAAFGIPEKSAPNKKALMHALAMQFKVIVDCTCEDAEDVICLEYQGYSEESQPADVGFMKPLYPGDDIYVNFQRKYTIKSTDTFLHTWQISNLGKQVWKGRKLIFVRGKKTRPEANPSVIEIPTVLPNNSIKITTTFDGRGFDGITDCIWEMQDSDGENCFPNRVALFCVTIDAKFKRS